MDVGTACGAERDQVLFRIVPRLAAKFLGGDLQVRHRTARLTVVKAVKGVDAIVDLAAIVGDPACEQDQSAAREINYGATRMLIEVARGHGVGRLLFCLQL
jgi:nucleoside-diphosphate-sugar epimerase